MKRIKKTLIAGVLACSALQARAEVNPWSAHVKGGLSLSWLRGGDITKIKVDNKEVSEQAVFSSPFFTIGLYGERAFNNYIGMELGLNYLKLGSVLKGKEASSNSSSGQSSTSSLDPCFFKIERHALNVPVSLCIYPLGREEDELIFKVFVGASLNFALSDKLVKLDEGKKSDQEEKLEADTKSFDVSGQVGIGLEFPIGVSLEARYGLGLMDIFATDSDPVFAKSKVTEIKNMKSHHTTLTVGYNVLNFISA